MLSASRPQLCGRWRRPVSSSCWPAPPSTGSGADENLARLRLIVTAIAYYYVGKLILFMRDSGGSFLASLLALKIRVERPRS